MQINTRYSFLCKYHSPSGRPFCPRPSVVDGYGNGPQWILPPCVYASCKVICHLFPNRWCLFSTLCPGCPCSLLWPAVWMEVTCEFRNSGGLTSSTQVLQPWIHHAMKKPSRAHWRWGHMEENKAFSEKPAPTARNKSKTILEPPVLLAKCSCTGEPRWNLRRNHQKRKCFKPSHLGVICYATMDKPLPCVWSLHLSWFCISTFCFLLSQFSSRWTHCLERSTTLIYNHSVTASSHGRK